MKAYTLKAMNEELRSKGVKVTKRDGEYRVSYAYRQNAEDSAYYTTDALDTGREMGRIK